MSAIPVAVALVMWCCLVLRYYLKVPRTRDFLPLVALTPLIALGVAAAEGFALDLTAWMLTAAAAVPWLATGFKPELMVDAEYVHGEDVTDEQQARIEKYQWRAILIVVALVVVVVGMIVFRDRFPE